MSKQNFSIDLTVEFRNALRPQLGVVEEPARVSVEAASHEEAVAAAPDALIAEWAKHYPHIEIIEITPA